MTIEEKTVVAVPVKNEEDFIPSCLRSLIAQTQQPDHIVLLLNNCTDRTAEICKAAQDHFEAIQIFEYRLTGGFASAGEARRLAFVHSLALAGNGIILTTDADAVPNAGWIEDNLHEFAAGADVVCGVPTLEEDLNVPCRRRLEFDDMRETLLLQLQDEIAACVDPDPFDPWPRHQQHSGASIAVRAATLREAGGPPKVASGEDRALIERLRLVDAKIRHAPGIVVPVSGRLDGRAVGGMAETLRRRIQAPDLLLDDRLEPTGDAYRRALAKSRLRAVRHGDHSADELAEDLLISASGLREILHLGYFGTAWARVQELSPVLNRRRVPCADLARETRQALALAHRLRAKAGLEAVSTNLTNPIEYEDAHRSS